MNSGGAGNRAIRQGAVTHPLLVPQPLDCPISSRRRSLALRLRLIIGRSLPRQAEPGSCFVAGMRMSPNQRFHKHEHLRRRADFQRVFARKCNVSDGVLVVYVAENGLTWSRLGLSVSRRVGNAVRRNQVRRRIREAFRTGNADIPNGFDIICVALPKAAERGIDVAHSLRSLVSEAIRGAEGREIAGRARSNRDVAR